MPRRNIVYAAFVLGSIGVISWASSQFWNSIPPEVRFASLLVTGIAATITIVSSVNDHRSSGETNSVQSVFDRLQQDPPLSKADLRDLGQAGTLSIYASEQAAKSYYNLSQDQKQELDTRLRSLRRGSVADVIPFRGESRFSDNGSFRYAMHGFTITFTIVGEKPSDAELLNITNQDAKTDVGIFIERIYER